jgi:hypothetical protein
LFINDVIKRSIANYVTLLRGMGRVVVKECVPAECMGGGLKIPFFDGSDL